MRKKKINSNVLDAAKGGGILTFGRILEYANRFILAFLLARLLGAEDYGLYSLALAISAIVSTMSLFGLDDAIMRYVAVYKAQKDDARLWGLFQFSLGFTIALSVMLSSTLYFLADWIAVQIFHTPELARLIRLVSFVIPFLSFSEMLMFASQGFKKMQYSVIAEQFVQLPLRVIIVLILIGIGLDPFLAILIFGFADAVASVVLIYFINKEFPLKRPLGTARWEIREIVNFAFPFWISDLLNTMRNRVQTVFLGSFSTITSVGIFTIVDRVNLLSKMGYRSILTSTKPIIADLQSKEDWKQVGNIYVVASRWGVTLNLPIFLVFLLFPKDFLFLFGSSFQEGAQALVVLAFSELVNTGTGLGGVIIDMTGQNRIKLFNSILQVTLSVVANVLLIRAMGLMGAAIATLISIGTINILRMLQVYWLYKLLPYNRSYLKLVGATLFSLAATVAITHLIPADLHILRIISGSIMILASFLGALIFFGLPPEEVEIFHRARKQIQKARAGLRLGQF